MNEQSSEYKNLLVAKWLLWYINAVRRIASKKAQYHRTYSWLLADLLEALVRPSRIGDSRQKSNIAYVALIKMQVSGAIVKSACPELISSAVNHTSVTFRIWALLACPLTGLIHF